MFNINSLNKIVKGFEQQFVKLFAQQFSYQALDFRAQTSIFTETGEFKAEMPQGCVGNKEAKDISRSKENYLYDKYVYDSDIEHEVLKVDPSEKVVVYGKLPRRSIKLPTYTGGTTSLDFVYAIRDGNTDDITLHFIVETKSDNLRESDIIAVEAQRKFFEQEGIKNIHWKMETNVAEFERDLKELAE